MRLHLGRAILGLAVLAFLAPSFARAAADEATVICKDGATSKGGRGACRGHGGVDKAATAKATGATAGAAAEAEGKTAVKKGEAAAAKKAEVAAPKADEAAAEATVVCKDGATSKGGRGACRGHGGVDKAASAKGAGAAAATAATAKTPAEPAPPPPAASAPAKATSTAAAAKATEKADDKKGPPSARCKDGTLSYAQHHTGACSRHGGVQEWLDKK